MSNYLLLAAASGGGGNFSQLAETFGLNWRMFLSQVIAFLIVAYVLKRFAYAPILQMLEERRSVIAETQTNSEQIKADLAKTEALRKETLAQADAQATKLIEEARLAADKERARLTQEAVATVKQMIEKAREANAAELVQMKVELRKEILRLVAETTAKVSGKVLTLQDQQRLAEETNKQLAA